MATQAQVKTWLSSHKGKSVDVDGYYGAQCMDLIVRYGLDLFKWHPTGDAKDLWTQKLPAGWKRIKNTPSFIPKAGDIAVFEMGQYGHTSICTGVGNKSRFNSLDQNWYNTNSVTGSPAAVVVHDYSRLIGVLRPPLTSKGEDMTAQDKKDLALGRKARKDNWQGQIRSLRKQLAEQTSYKNYWRAKYIGYLRSAGKSLAAIPAKIRNLVK